MKLNEAKEILNNRGYIVESADIDDFELFDRKIKEIIQLKADFKEVADTLDALFRENYLRAKFQIGYEGPQTIMLVFLDNGTRIKIHQNWNVTIDAFNFEKKFLVWSKEKAINCVKENMKHILK